MYRVFDSPEDPNSKGLQRRGPLSLEERIKKETIEKMKIAALKSACLRRREILVAALNFNRMRTISLEGRELKVFVPSCMDEILSPECAEIIEEFLFKVANCKLTLVRKTKPT